MFFRFPLLPLFQFRSSDAVTGRFCLCLGCTISSTFTPQQSLCLQQHIWQLLHVTTLAKTQWGETSYRLAPSCRYIDAPWQQLKSRRRQRFRSEHTPKTFTGIPVSTEIYTQLPLASDWQFKCIFRRSLSSYKPCFTAILFKTLAVKHTEPRAWAHKSSFAEKVHIKNEQQTVSSIKMVFQSIMQQAE